MSKRLFIVLVCRSIAVTALGLGLFAATLPAQAGKSAGLRTSSANVAKATPNPVRPKAIRDHRQSCIKYASKPGCRPAQPYRT